MCECGFSETRPKYARRGAIVVAVFAQLALRHCEDVADTLMTSTVGWYAYFCACVGKYIIKLYDHVYEARVTGAFCVRLCARFRCVTSASICRRFVSFHLLCVQICTRTTLSLSLKRQYLRKAATIRICLWYKMCQNGGATAYSYAYTEHSTVAFNYTQLHRSCAW